MKRKEGNIIPTAVPIALLCPLGDQAKERSDKFSLDDGYYTHMVGAAGNKIYAWDINVFPPSAAHLLLKLTSF